MSKNGKITFCSDYTIRLHQCAGITQKDLVSVYVSVVRPVLDYACPVWHTNLPQYLSDNIEVIQKGH